MEWVCVYAVAAVCTPRAPPPTHYTQHNELPPKSIKIKKTKSGHVDLEAYLVTYAFLPESPVVTGIEYRNTSLTADDIGERGAAGGGGEIG